jgi:peptidoglycan-associated lipoprotein
LKSKWLTLNENILIEGQCDERGTTEYNLALGDRRAASTKRYLISLGIAPARPLPISCGEEKPADPRQNEAAWARTCGRILSLTETLIRGSA